VAVKGAATKKTGRPVKGRDAQGNPAPASKTFPQLTVRLDPRVREKIERLARLRGTSQGDAIAMAVDAYVGALSERDRATFEGLPAKSGQR